MQSRKLTLNIAGVILFLAAGASAMFLTPSDSPEPQKAQPSPAPTVTQSPSPEPAKPAEWYVYITGAVHSPGVYTLPEHSRIFQAVDAAGGFTSRADTTALNLAAYLEDSAHIHIPERGTSTPKTAPSPKPAPKATQTQTQPSLYISGRKVSAKTAGKTTNSGLVDVNNASAKELEQLKGVGPAISKRIVEYRQTHGRFNTPEDLINVRGIGAKTLEKMRSQILIR